MSEKTVREQIDWFEREGKFLPIYRQIKTFDFVIAIIIEALNGLKVIGKEEAKNALDKADLGYKAIPNNRDKAMTQAQLDSDVKRMKDLLR